MSKLYPLIILGAGASHDFSPNIEKSKRPPVTNDLVKEEFIDNELMSAYKDIRDLLSEIISSIERDGGFEQTLKRLKDNWGNNPKRKSQFIALQFYLRDLFENISRNNHSFISNYRTLFNRIHDLNGGNGRACVVSFNYDTLFEQSIDDIEWNSMSSYISNNIKLIKPHGSWNWAYVGNKDKLEFKYRDYSDEYDFLTKNPEYINNSIKKGTIPYHVEEINNSGKEYHKFPTIAVPLPDKHEFVCPDKHISTLEKALLEIDRVLVIGWSASDPNLLELLRDKINREVKLMVISKDKNSAQKIADNIKVTNSKLICRASKSKGFSDFIESGEFEEFLEF